MSSKWPGLGLENQALLMFWTASPNIFGKTHQELIIPSGIAYSHQIHPVLFIPIGVLKQGLASSPYPLITRFCCMLETGHSEHFTLKVKSEWSATTWLWGPGKYYELKKDIRGRRRSQLFPVSPAKMLASSAPLGGNPPPAGSCTKPFSWTPTKETFKGFQNGVFPVMGLSSSP